MTKFPLYDNMDIVIENMIWKKGKMLKELYKLGYDPIDASMKFQTSKIGKEWDSFEKYEYVQWYYGQSAQAFTGDCASLGTPIKKIQPGEYLPKLWLCVEQLDPDVIEWVGRIYETWSRYSGLSSREVYEKLDFCDMYTAWDMGHMDGEYNFVRALAAHPEEYKLPDPEE